jgi:hypothetical protein
MHDLKSLELPDLFNLLIEHTAHHKRMFATQATAEELRISGEILRELQTEIEIRQARYKMKIMSRLRRLRLPMFQADN